MRDIEFEGDDLAYGFAFLGERFEMRANDGTKSMWVCIPGVMV